MTADEMNLLVIKGMISEMPEDERDQVNQFSDKIRGLVKENPTAGCMALSLVALELQVSAG
jgi:hypothetical protein